MRRFWPGTLRATFAVMTLALLAGCERETTPPLIEVRGVSPRELEEGDRLTIEGVGFPEGKVAHVAFRGDLHRPGVPVVTNVLIEVDAVVVSSSEVDIPFNAAIERLFAGPGDHAAHTTFRGDVTVAFAAKTPAASATSARGLKPLRYSYGPSRRYSDSVSSRVPRTRK